RAPYGSSRGVLAPATGPLRGMLIPGIDAVAFQIGWWTRERRRFRAYISGPPYWDNVYAAIMCSHGRGQIISDRRLIFHEQHPSTWRPEGPLADYNGFLAALDAPYFSPRAVYIS